MAVDMIARMMAMGNGGGSGDSYTKAQTDALLDGKADLVDGKVPAAQLPSYVDDVDAALSSTSTNPVQNKAIQAPLAMLIDNGAKNLLNFRDPLSASSGITVVNNYDGTYSMTANVDVISNVLFNISLEKGGGFILSGCPSGGGVSSYLLRIHDKDGSVIDKSYDTGNSSDEFQLNAGDYQLVVRFAPGTYSNIVFKPMLCTAEDWAVSHKFVPYAPTNRELYNDVNVLNQRIESFVYNSSTSKSIILSRASSATFLALGFVQGIGNIYWILEIDGSGNLTVKNGFDGSTVSAAGISFNKYTKTLTFTSQYNGNSNITIIMTSV